MMEREVAMQVDERTMKCVAFVGESGTGGFRADGTAFFLSVTEEGAQDFVYLVTCRHNVHPHVMGGADTPERNDDPIWVRVNRKVSRPKIYETRRGDWICHKDRFVDVCV